MSFTSCWSYTDSHPPSRCQYERGLRFGADDLGNPAGPCLAWDSDLTARTRRPTKGSRDAPFFAFEGSGAGHVRGNSPGEQPNRRRAQQNRAVAIPVANAVPCATQQPNGPGSAGSFTPPRGRITRISSTMPRAIWISASLIPNAPWPPDNCCATRHWPSRPSFASCRMAPATDTGGKAP